MSLHLDKKSILKKTIQFGGLTLISRFMGIIRDMLIGRFLGVGAISDAFIMAFRIPNFLRKIFAEGALSAAFVPVFVKKVKNKELENTNGLMTLSFLFFEGIVFLLCLLVFIFPEYVIAFIAPGFSQEQVGYAVPCLKLLFPLIFFVSSSALFAGALNSVNHFFIPAFGPVLLNISYISTLLLCLKFNFSVNFLCLGILFGGFLNFFAHAIFYFRYNFSFGRIDKSSVQAFKLILSKFLPSLLGVSIIEINLFVDTIIASFLPQGYVSLLYYSGLFVNMPVGIFAVGFATVLLPQFSRYALYAPKRLNFYVLEVCKFITWLITPVMLFMIFSSERIFSVVMLGKKATPETIWNAKWILTILLMALIFFCLNKILVNLFYSLHDTKMPTIALVISTVTNFAGNILGLKFWGAFGIAASTSFSAVILSVFLFYFLRKKHKFKFYTGNYFNFLIRYIIQLTIACLFFIISYLLIEQFLKNYSIYNFFIYGWGFWFIVFPLAGICALFLFFTRKFFGLELYFLNK